MFKKIGEILKHLDLLSLSIPTIALVASAVLPLQPIIRQAMIGVMMVWLGLEAMTGFSLEGLILWQTINSRSN